MEVSKLIIPSNGEQVTVNIKDATARQAIADLDGISPSDVADKDATLSWGTKTEIATIGELSIHVTLPNNPSADKVNNSEKGVANGVATLDANGKVPASQLPSYVDDVIEGYYHEGTFYEEAAHTTAITPETGKIYIDLSTNKSYRWGGSTMVEIAGDGGSVKGSITVTLTALVNGTQGSTSLLNGATITLTNTTRSQQVDTIKTWAGLSITFAELTPLEDYRVTVTNPSTSEWAISSLYQDITNLGIQTNETVEFEYEADEYTCAVNGANAGKVIVNNVEYSAGDTFRVAKGSTITPTSKEVANYTSQVSTAGKVITADYTAYGTVTVSTLSNLDHDSTIATIVPQIKIGSAAAVDYTGAVQVGPDTTIVVTWPAVAGYKTPEKQEVVKTGTTNETISGTYYTEKVVVTVNTDEDGVTAEGQIITVNGSTYTVDSTGVITAYVPFDTVYSISANGWAGEDDYTTPSSQSNITAAIAERTVTMTYEKIRGTLYSLVVTDNQSGASNAATNATVTVSYVQNQSTVTLGTTYKNGDTFLIPNDATNLTVTGNASFGSYTNKNFAPNTTVSGTTYTVTYRAQKVTVTSNSSTTITLTNTTKSSSISSVTGTSTNGYVAWGNSWKVSAPATTSKYPAISPSTGTANSASTSVSITMTSYTLITSGEADLGLPSGKLWSATNVGASNYYDAGLYFSWGDTTGHAKNSGYNFSSANYSSGASGSGHNLMANFTSGDATYDGAKANMGGTWRTPTYDELNELKSNCTWIWTTLNSTNGYLVIKNSKAIFLPASGYYDGTTLNYSGSYGYYWSTGYYSSSNAYYLDLDRSNKSMRLSSRYYGFSIRAIKDPEAVDLGSGVKWATGNLTKDSSGNYSIAPATDYGAYFSWGNTNGQRVAGQTDSYSFDSTTYNSTTGHNLTADFTSGSTTYDAARVRLGSPWRIPTYDELNWLKNNCTWNWKASGNTDYNGVAGYEVVGTNSNKIFLPCAGSYNGTSLSDSGTSGRYWSTKYSSSTNACYLYFSSSNKGLYYSNRYCGLSIRPVQ